MSLKVGFCRLSRKGSIAFGLVLVFDRTARAGFGLLDQELCEQLRLDKPTNGLETQFLRFEPADLQSQQTTRTDLQAHLVSDNSRSRHKPVLSSTLRTPPHPPKGRPEDAPDALHPWTHNAAAGCFRGSPQ
jgi:hypothetical protein